MMLKAARTSILLPLLFLVVYGGCNWLTALRHGVGSFYFSWERHIPFVPAMIVPYMLIDLFFVVAPFLCRTDRERQVLARRITAAILIAGACFLSFPLRFAFERPSVGGLLGAVFNSFRMLDRPFNQFPSLHITLGIILADFYGRRISHRLRIACYAWFTLIGLSTIFTYQHHVIDLLGGAAAGILCLYFFREENPRLPVTCNYRIGCYYAAAVLLVSQALLSRSWSYVLLWPAASLAIVATAYFGIGPGIFRKSRGGIPLSSRLTLWPVLAGQKLSLAHYAKRSRRWDVLTEHVWIGRKLSDDEAREAMDAGVSAVLDLTGEFPEARPFLDLTYLNVPIMDLTAPTPAQLDAAVDFIDCESQHGVVYVHCKIGYSRTAAIAGAWLLAGHLAESPERVVAMLRAARPGIIIRAEAVEALRQYHARLQSVLVRDA